MGVSLRLSGAGGEVSLGAEHARWPLRPTWRPVSPPGRLLRDGSGRLADGVGEGQQVVGRGPGCRRVGCQPEHLPPARRGESFAVWVTQVIGVRLGVRRQGSEDCGLIGVDVGQRVDRWAATGTTRTATGRTHEGDGTAQPPGTRLGSRRGADAGDQAKGPGPARARNARPRDSARAGSAPRSDPRSGSCSTTSCSASWRSSRRAGSSSSDWWSTPSRTRRRSPTTGIPTTCRSPRSSGAAEPRRPGSCCSVAR